MWTFIPVHGIPGNVSVSLLSVLFVSIRHCTTENRSWGGLVGRHWRSYAKLYSPHNIGASLLGLLFVNIRHWTITGRIRWLCLAVMKLGCTYVPIGLSRSRCMVVRRGK
jgi:hypothetical protein